MVEISVGVIFYFMEFYENSMTDMKISNSIKSNFSNILAINIFKIIREIFFIA